jgi:hypothetical protein
MNADERGSYEENSTVGSAVAASLIAGPRSSAGRGFSPDGKWLASAGSSDETVMVWDAGTGRETLTLKGHNRYFESAETSVIVKRLRCGPRNQQKLMGRQWKTGAGSKSMGTRAFCSILRNGTKKTHCPLSRRMTAWSAYIAGYNTIIAQIAVSSRTRAHLRKRMISSIVQRKTTASVHTNGHGRSRLARINAGWTQR